MLNLTSAHAKGPHTLNVAATRRHTEAEGPGLRYALWVQGCPMRCPGCCNPHYLEDKQAQLRTVDALVEDILATPDIEGVTLIGGEPFWQAEGLASLAQRVREAGLSVMVFTGFTLKFIHKQDRPHWNALLAHVDLLVDGTYIESKRVTDRRWIGSSNQREHFLTPRYAALAQHPAGWDEGANTIELRMTGNEVFINGYPEQSIIDLAAASIKPVRPKKGSK